MEAACVVAMPAEDRRELQMYVEERKAKEKQRAAARRKRKSRRSGREYSWKEKVYCLFDLTEDAPDERWERAALIVSGSVFAFIFISVVTFVLQSVPAYESADGYFSTIEVTCVVVFSVEFAVKLTTCPCKRRFVKDFYNWIDLVSIMPFYVDHFVRWVFNKENNLNFLFLRVVRLARIFRMFKLGKYNRPFGMVLLVMINSIDALFLLVFMLFMSVILFSSLMWMAEQTSADFDLDERAWIRDDGTISPFQSIPHTFWWCMCTLTTVGYGDDVPTSSAGKVVAGITILTGVFVMAFPVILISYNYSEMTQRNELSELYRGRMKEKKRDEAAAEAASKEARPLLFDASDTAPSGAVESLPDVGSRIASWRHSGRIIGLYFNGALGGCPSFCHDPVYSLRHSQQPPRPKQVPASNQLVDTHLHHHTMVLLLGSANCTARGLRALGVMPLYDAMTLSKACVFRRPILQLT
eukprot:Rhum_TRINITY_DN12475_c0_g3::Rhum_TRINITY_DN12475_c0_g3_i1::g.51922::m.51922